MNYFNTLRTNQIKLERYESIEDMYKHYNMFVDYKKQVNIPKEIFRQLDEYINILYIYAVYIELVIKQ